MQDSQARTTGCCPAGKLLVTAAMVSVEQQTSAGAMPAQRPLPAGGLSAADMPSMAPSAPYRPPVCLPLSSYICLASSGCPPHAHWGVSHPFFCTVADCEALANFCRQPLSGQLWMRDICNPRFHLGRTGVSECPYYSMQIRQASNSMLMQDVVPFGWPTYDNMCSSSPP